MAETKSDAEQDPSIEDILQSIRQIISEDDEEGADDAEMDAAPEPEPEPEPTPEPEPETEDDDEDVLDLTDKVDDGSDADDDLDAILDEPEDKPQIAMEDMQDDAPKADMPVDASLLSEHAESAAIAALNKLSANMFVERQDHMLGITLEDIVREMMRPLLKDWLDNNLPKIVEQQVQKEIRSLVNKMQDGM